MLVSATGVETRVKTRLGKERQTSPKKVGRPGTWERYQSAMLVPSELHHISSRKWWKHTLETFGLYLHASKGVSELKWKSSMSGEWLRKTLKIIVVFQKWGWDEATWRVVLWKYGSVLLWRDPATWNHFPAVPVFHVPAPLVCPLASTRHWRELTRRWFSANGRIQLLRHFWNTLAIKVTEITSLYTLNCCLKFSRLSRWLKRRWAAAMSALLDICGTLLNRSIY